MREGRAPFQDDHGVFAWPDAVEACAPLPGTLPDGRPWPRIVVVVLPGSSGDATTLASLTAQDYPELQITTCSAASEAGKATGSALADPGIGYVLRLGPGEMLAPGALAALCLEAELTGAGAVAGLRVLCDRDVHGLDLLAIAPVHGSGEDVFSGCGDILVARAALLGLDAPETDILLGSAGLWARLGAAGTRRSRIGRPVLLRIDTAHAPARTGMHVAALTDLGDGGGAGIAHRRLAEALDLAGHRVTHVRLSDESPPAAAEWTDAFPRTEAALRAGGYDLVLAGNLHGATRGGGLIARLAPALPTALVLHDLFALTGRCAHPKGCPIIATGCDARCPTPTEYPQLSPGRIAGAYSDKRRALAAPLLLANSAWTEERAHALAPGGTAIARIQLAFPTGVFRPRDRTALRKKLGLPEHVVLILFAAVIADAPDKGFHDLVATMRRVARPGIGFVAVGRLDDPGAFGLAGLHAPGPIGDEETLAQWYAACDIYLTASRLETLGQTPIEAGLCGTPTVAYRATGLTSAVIDGVTGLLVDPREGALAEGLETLIADTALCRRLGGFARIVLENRFSHAAAAISLHDALAGWPGMPALDTSGRLRFRPEMLGQFACAKHRHAGATGLVAAPSRPLVRRLRRAKQAVFGRGMPLWMRRALYAAALLRRKRGLMSQAPRRVYVDQTNLRGPVTGIERVALDLFAPEMLAPHDVRLLKSPGLARMMLDQHVAIPARGLLDRAALFVFPGFPPGPLALALGPRCVTYVHDTFLLTRPQDLNWRARAYMAPSFALALRFGRTFLVNSRTTGEDLRRFCRRDALVALLRPTVRDVFGLADLPRPAVYAPGEPLRLLAIGTIEPRKNYPAAIALTAALAAAGIPAELHIVGRVGWGRNAFVDAPPPFVTLHGYLDDSGLRSLAGRCHALLSTAKAEGLGLPLLEIQHGGLPVIASEGPVFSEVLGASGLFIGPDDPVAAARAILASARDGRLAAATSASRANVARWNGLAAGDADRFRAFVGEGAVAYAGHPAALVTQL